MRYFLITFFWIVMILESVHGNAQSFDHSIFDSLLQENVKNGLVNYRALKADQVLLIKYLKKLEQVDFNNFEKWSSNDQKAFWINAYNAITIDGILRNYPIKWGGLMVRARFPKNSIRQIKKFWDTVFIKVIGRNLTLNQIEHEILRKQFDDPRIHFVIVCASMGCPILESRSFFAEELDQRLERATRNFINNPDKVRMNKEENKIYLSSIFDWYKEDFRVSEEIDLKLKKYSKKERGVVAFVLNYLPEIDRKYIIDNHPKIKYLDYDWSLNEQR